VGTRPIESDVLSLFPTFVWKVRWAPDLVARVDATVRATATLANGAWRELPPGSGWQSAPDLHRLPAMREFVACVRDAAKPVLRFLRAAEHSLDVTGCWINVNARGSAHRVHVHPNNYLSGVYYVHTAPGADTVNFHDPRPQTSVLRAPVTALTAENADQVVVHVEDGMLLLFPAYLPHSVTASESDRLRISVSFNLMFEDSAERWSAANWSGGDSRRGRS